MIQDTLRRETSGIRTELGVAKIVSIPFNRVVVPKSQGLEREKVTNTEGRVKSVSEGEYRLLLMVIDVYDPLELPFIGWETSGKG